MTSPAPTSEFGQGNIDKVFSTLVSVDEELKNYFDDYLRNEYDDTSSERVNYLDIAEIGQFLIERIKTGQTFFFQDLFTQVEVIFQNAIATLMNSWSLACSRVFKTTADTKESTIIKASTNGLVPFPSKNGTL